MTTPVPTPADPVERLLRRLVEQDDLRREIEEERALAVARVEAALTEMKAEQVRTTGAIREVRNELSRQDTQMRAFDERIGGNYRGIASRLDDLDEDLKSGNRLIGNLETAVVDLTRASRMLHGRMIEESDIVGARIKKSETGLELTQAEVGTLDKRLGSAEASVRALEKRFVSQDPFEGSLGAGGLGGG